MMITFVFRCTLALLLALSFINPALAKKPTSVAKAPITLSDYIELHCRKGCVDAELLKQSVWDASEEQSLDPLMLLAIVKVESGFIPEAKSGSNRGLMQVHLKWHKPKFNGSKPTEVKPNVTVGASIYREYLDRERGNVVRALRRYNGYGDPGYVTKVQKARRELAMLFDLKRDPVPQVDNLQTTKVSNDRGQGILPGEDLRYGDVD